MKRLAYLGIVGLVLLAVSTPVWGALWGSQETLEGTIQSIQSNIITLAKDAQGEQGEEIIEVQVNEETEYDQLASLDALEVGDKIEVEFKEEQGQKVATKISLAEEEANIPETGSVVPDKQDPEASAPNESAPGNTSPVPSY